MELPFEMAVFVVGLTALVFSVAVRRVRPRVGNASAVTGVLLLAGLLIL